MNKSKTKNSAKDWLNYVYGKNKKTEKLVQESEKQKSLTDNLNEKLKATLTEQKELEDNKNADKNDTKLSDLVKKVDEINTENKLNNSKLGIKAGENSLKNSALPTESEMTGSSVEKFIKSQEESKSDFEKDWDARNGEKKTYEEELAEVLPKTEEKYTDRQTSSYDKSYEEMMKSLKGIEDKFSGVTDKDYFEDKLPAEIDVPDLKKYEMPEIDEDEITKSVKAELENQYNIEKNNLKSENERSVEDKEAEKEKIINYKEDNKTEINAVYDAERVVAENDALKRGLARSSYAVLRLGNIEDSRASELVNLSKELASNLATKEAEINALNTKLNTSLENLDLALAVKIQTSIEEKVNELKDKQEEVIAYNNKISELESEYNTKRNENIKEIADEEVKLAKEYEGIAKRDRENQMYNEAVLYYNSLPKNDAILAIINDVELARLLGDKFYDLYYATMRRK